MNNIISHCAWVVVRTRACVRYDRLLQLLFVVALFTPLQSNAKEYPLPHKMCSNEFDLPMVRSMVNHGGLLPAPKFEQIIVVQGGNNDGLEAEKKRPLRRYAVLSKKRLARTQMPLRDLNGETRRGMYLDIGNARPDTPKTCQIVFHDRIDQDN